MIEHIVSHLGEAMALKTLAEQACLSPFHFHRVFRGMVETPLELVRTVAPRAGWRGGCSHRRTGHRRSRSTRATRRTRRSRAPSARATPIRRRDSGGAGDAHRARRRRTACTSATTAPISNSFHATPEDGRCRSRSGSTRRSASARCGTSGPYIQINEAFARLGELAAPARLFERPGAQMVALFHDDPRHDAGRSAPIRRGSGRCRRKSSCRRG